MPRAYVFALGTLVVTSCQNNTVVLSSEGSSAGRDTTGSSSPAGPADSTGATDPVSTGSGQEPGTTDDPLPTTGPPPVDLPGRPPPLDPCHELPEVMPGPTPIWCVEWLPDGDNASGHRVDVADDGSIVATGYVDGSTAFDDAFITRFTAAGAPLWTQGFAEGAVGPDEALGVGVDGAGDVIVGGVGSFDPGMASSWLARYSADGMMEWTLEVPNTFTMPSAWRLAAYPDGSFVTGGTVNGVVDEARVARYSADGVLAWEHGVTPIVDIGFENMARGVTLDGAGNIYASASLSDGTLWIARLTPDGALLWDLIVSGPVGAQVDGFDIAVTTDGDIYVTGIMGLGVWVGRLAADGGFVWFDQTAEGGDWDYATGITPVPGGDVVMVGARSDVAPNREIWMRRYTAEGSVAWDYTVGGTGGFDDRANDVEVTPDGDIVVIGTIWQEGTRYAWLARFTP